GTKTAVLKRFICLMGADEYYVCQVVAATTSCADLRLAQHVQATWRYSPRIRRASIAIPPIWPVIGIRRRKTNTPTLAAPSASPNMCKRSRVPQPRYQPITPTTPSTTPSTPTTVPSGEVTRRLRKKSPQVQPLGRNERQSQKRARAIITTEAAP